MIIRAGKREDISELQQVFTHTIKAVCSADYSEEQLAAWASRAQDLQRWQNVMEQQCVWVVEKNEDILGFATLDKGTYIDLFFVHQDHQRKGIAQMLYAQIEKEARKQGKDQLTSDISKTAKPFFERQGFRVIREQQVDLKGVYLTNFKMEKNLKEPEH